jgi:gas vesicle protein
MAVLAGTTAGIIAGLLMAPKTGSGLRKDLGLSAKQAKNKVVGALREYVQKQQPSQTE